MSFLLKLLVCASCAQTPKDAPPPTEAAPANVVETNSTQPRIDTATTIALLLDGTLLAGFKNGDIVPLNPRSGFLADSTQRLFARHPAAIRNIAVDPRGELVAASSADGRVVLWPVGVLQRSGEVEYPGHYGVPNVIFVPAPVTLDAVVEIEWTHDGSHLVTWSYRRFPHVSPKTVQIWTGEGELVWTGPHALQVDVHPSELRIAAVLENEVHLGWPLESMQRIPLEGARDAVEFSPDGTQLAVGGLEWTAWILDAKSGAIERTRDVGKVHLFGLPGHISRVRWSLDGRLLAVVGGKGLNPGVLDPTDLSITWAGGLFGGRGTEEFDVAWTPGGRLLTGFGEVLAIDPSDGSNRLLLDKAEWAAVLPVGTEGEVLLFAPPKLLRLNPTTGAVAWSR